MEDVNELYFKTGVYYIKFAQINKIYIGITSRSFFKRLEEHMGQLKKQKHYCKKLLSLYNGLGYPDLELHILEIISDKHERIVKESCWLDYFKMKKNSSLILNSERKGGHGIQFNNYDEHYPSQICQLKNVKNNKKYLSINENVTFFRDSQLNKLINQTHVNDELQIDFNTLGQRVFEFSFIKKTNQQNIHKDFYIARKHILTTNDYSKPPKDYIIKMSDRCF